MSARTIQRLLKSQSTQDGDGVAIQRIALMGDSGSDPLLLLDELRSAYREDFAGGFPAHPHRGMQTLTYMKEGGIIHEDSMGNRGEIRGGGAQYLSAGSGVIHSEMPTLDTQGLHGFQMWFNLPAADKMSAPRYRDIPEAQLAHHETTDFQAAAIAGSWEINGTLLDGPLVELVPQASVLDLRLMPGAGVTLPISLGDNCVAYVYDGAVVQAGQVIKSGNLLMLGEGDHWQVAAPVDSDAGLLVIAGRPIREPVVGYGPFVMNTRAEIEDAIRDYQSGRLVQAAI